MNTFKKLLALTLALVFAVMGLVACNKDSDSKSDKDDKKSSTVVHTGYSSAEECMKDYAKYRFNCDYKKMYAAIPGDYAKKYLEDWEISDSDFVKALDSAAKEAKSYMETNSMPVVEIVNASNEYEDYLDDYEAKYGIKVTEAQYIDYTVSYNNADGEEYTKSGYGKVVKVGENWFIDPYEMRNLFDIAWNYLEFDDNGKGYDTPEACAEDLVKYYNAGEYQKVYDTFPVKYQKWHKKDYGYTMEELNTGIAYASESRQNDLRDYGYVIGDAEAELDYDFDEDYLADLNEGYSINATEGKSMKVLLHYTYDGEPETYTDYVYVVKINGKWYASPGEFYSNFYSPVSYYMPGY